MSSPRAAGSINTFDLISCTPCADGIAATFQLAAFALIAGWSAKMGIAVARSLTYHATCVYLALFLAREGSDGDSEVMIEEKK